MTEKWIVNYRAVREFNDPHEYHQAVNSFGEARDLLRNMYNDIKNGVGSHVPGFFLTSSITAGCRDFEIETDSENKIAFMVEKASRKKVAEFWIDIETKNGSVKSASLI